MTKIVRTWCVRLGARLGCSSYLPRLAAAVTALEVTCLDLAGIGFGSWLRRGMANIAELKFLLHGQMRGQITAQGWIRFVQRARSSHDSGNRGRQNSGVELTTRCMSPLSDTFR